MIVGKLRTFWQRCSLNHVQTYVLVLFFACNANIAVAQNKDEILARADEISGFMELFEDENPFIQQMAIADGMASDNRMIRDAAIASGFASEDMNVRKETMIGLLRAKPVYLVEIPVELDPRIASDGWTQFWSMARLEVSSEYFNPDRFSLAARGGSKKYTLNCVLRGDEILCRGKPSNSELKLRPGEFGTLRGTVESGDWTVPIMIRNF